MQEAKERESWFVNRKKKLLRGWLSMEQRSREVWNFHFWKFLKNSYIQSLLLLALLSTGHWARQVPELPSSLLYSVSTSRKIWIQLIFFFISLFLFSFLTPKGFLHGGAIVQCVQAGLYSVLVFSLPPHPPLRFWFMKDKLNWQICWHCSTQLFNLLLLHSGKLLSCSLQPSAIRPASVP